MTRKELTQKIVSAKLSRKLTWQQLADAVGQGVVWTTSALLGQNTMNAAEAAAAAKLLDLDDEAVTLLQTPAYRGSLDPGAPTDPVVARFNEIVQVYGTTLKELIHEQFGDGIMSAIDFSMTMEKVPDPKGDRVKITLNGKFLPYKKF